MHISQCYMRYKEEFVQNVMVGSLHKLVDGGTSVGIGHAKY